jgi:hypothetical protein
MNASVQQSSQNDFGDESGNSRKTAENCRGGGVFFCFRPYLLLVRLHL